MHDLIRYKQQYGFTAPNRKYTSEDLHQALVKAREVIENQPCPVDNRYVFIDPIVYARNFDEQFRRACGNCINQAQYNRVKRRWDALRRLRDHIHRYTEMLANGKAVKTGNKIGDIEGVDFYATLPISGEDAG